MRPALIETNLPYPVRHGKVRDVYDLGGDRLLLVATDRISAYDVVLPDGVPEKGALLTAISNFWFDQFSDVPNHLIDPTPSPRDFGPSIARRAVIARKLEIVQFECVARGYLAGSGWKEYRESGTVCGIKLPAGLRNGDRLPEPIFTPATKAETGHDQNVSFTTMTDAIGVEAAGTLRDATLSLFNRATEYAGTRGLLLADTKFEFGRDADGRLVLADEALTPDSSRYWPADAWRPGKEQPSFDKQFVREYLAGIGWDRKPPGPTLPATVIQGTSDRYREAARRLGVDLT
jgi:phosphoribosylaminoimidazole-succinocarboxamide synthase